MKRLVLLEHSRRVMVSFTFSGSVKHAPCCTITLSIVVLIFMVFSALPFLLSHKANLKSLMSAVSAEKRILFFRCLYSLCIHQDNTSAWGLFFSSPSTSTLSSSFYSGEQIQRPLHANRTLFVAHAATPTARGPQSLNLTFT